MKKILSVICLMLLLTFFTADFKLFADDAIKFDPQSVVMGGGTYKVTERTSHDDLGYGVKYTRDVALSQSLNQQNGLKNFDPQVVNVLEVPSSKTLKVVNWTYSSSSKWTLATVQTMARDFELRNPGWIVLGATNGDFFDNKHRGALEGQTVGSAVVNGEVYRAITGGSHVGFTNDGSTDSLIGAMYMEYDPTFKLTVYDENENVTNTFNVDKFNEAPVGDEVSVYFSYYSFDSENKRIEVKATAPASNSFTVDAPVRSYAPESNKFYGKGMITSMNESKELFIGQFSIVTTNEDVKASLKDHTMVRIQQEVTGDYARCPNITGAGARLLDNGEYVNNGADVRHPRTMVGQKADGTIVMATVDGRQQAKNMYGMTHEEMSALMKYYGCTEAYNLDGGGSTTMILRNEFGEFDTMNSPSDGNDRHDANALLVVVPEMKLSIDKATDTNVTMSYVSRLKDMTISNVKVTIEADGFKETKALTADTFTWEGLTPKTDYTLTYTYDLTYMGQTLSNTSKPMSFSTGGNKPTVDGLCYTEDDNYYIFKYKINDPDNVLTFARIKYDRRSSQLDKTSEILYVEKSKVKEPKFTLILTYNLGATPNRSIDESIEIKKEEAKPVPPTPTPEVEDGKKCGKKCGALVVEILAVTAALGIVLRKHE